MDEYQSPEHSELRHAIVTGLNRTHTLLAKQPNANVSRLDHGHIILPIPNGQGNLARSVSD